MFIAIDLEWRSGLSELALVPMTSMHQLMEHLMEPLMQVVRTKDRGIVRWKRARRVMQVSGQLGTARRVVGGALMERAWVLADAACASGATPGTCRGADSGLLCSSAEGGNRGGRPAECGCPCAAGEAG